MGALRSLVHRRLPAHPSSVPEARALLRRSLVTAAREDLLDDITLLVSELVTNALVHAGTPMTLTASVHGQAVRVELTDGSPHLPMRRDYTTMAGTGRGLLLLEQLVDRWGAEPHPDGKTVWFELDAGARQQPGRRAVHVLTDEDPESHRAPRDGTVVVTLLGVPLLLHQAWHPHAEALLREYLLFRLDEDSAALAELQTHAAATEAMALLRTHIPAPDVGEDPEAVMATAVEPLVSADRVLLPLPAESVPHFEVLDRTLDAALDMADAGMLLNPPTQPELRTLRKWLCREVITQSAGGGATAWSPNGLPAGSPPARPPSPHRCAEITADPHRAMVAADDTDRIIALSRAALEILGYAAPEEIVGRRLVDIIPERYRQAHLAGFTLHLAVGRRPLLDTTVTVPALRRDGSEVVVDLTVTARHLPDGDRVFVAELREPR